MVVKTANILGRELELNFLCCAETKNCKDSCKNCQYGKVMLSITDWSGLVDEIIKAHQEQVKLLDRYMAHLQEEIARCGGDK